MVAHKPNVPRPRGTEPLAAAPDGGVAATEQAEAGPLGSGGVSAPKKGEIISEKYKLNRLIGMGGMGSVWAGEDLALERPVAIKFMDPSIAASETLRARFNREAKAAAQLRTPYVVQIHEHGVHDQLPYIAMELLEGEDLHARLKRQRRLPLKTAARIVTQAAKALRKAHAMGIVHRDLKPQNVFLHQEDDEKVVKILDFGIAKRTGGDGHGDTTKTGHVLGSPNYMSPEQARGLKGVDHRSDLWSLGVILYRMITARKAFTGEASGDVIVKICTDPVPPPTSVLPELPRAVDQFFDRALARNPDERFQSAMEFAQAFADIAAAAQDVSLFTPAPDTGHDMTPAGMTPASSPGLASGAPGTPPPASDSRPSGSYSGVNVQAPGATPVELTPAPMSGSTGGSLALPSVVDVARPPMNSRRWLLYAVLGSAFLIGGLTALILLSSTPPTDESASLAASGAESSTAGPTEEPSSEPSTPAPAESVAEPEPSSTATAAATAAPTVAAAPKATATPPPRPTPRPRPRPKPTADGTKPPKWGY